MPEMSKYSQGTESFQQFAIRIADMLLEPEKVQRALSMFRKSRVSSIMKLTNLLEEFHGTQAEYLDIVNYEIARENICGYIFLLSRISQNAEPTEKMQMESKIEDLIYYRDNLQIEDKKNIQKVLNELIPEYKAEQEKQRAKKN